MSEQTQLEKAMQPELQEKLISILNWVEETAKQAGGFVVEQTPLYIQELLAWNFWQSLIWFIFAIFGLIGLIYGCFKLFQWMREEDVWELSPLGLVLIIPFIAILCTIENNLDWLQISVAPRVWLVEYVASKL